MKSSKEIRNDFINFFKNHDHTFVPSAPVVPQDDPTLLFTNAGMNQFKSIFLGDNQRGLRRAANSQKCMRVSGKHNDLEEVGRDHYHHTFFEMLGNWSFGDYYKKEAIRWGWELLTEVWKLPKERLFATVFKDDNEAIAYWKSETDIPHDRIMRFGEKSNFWEMGETGPCGPCSEIHYDMGDAATRGSTFADPVAGVNGENARYRELWNLVFIQYNREKGGALVPLKSKHVDTGMGFERVVAVLQGADYNTDLLIDEAHSNYHTDLFKPILHELQNISGRKYLPTKEGIPFRVAADHIRSLVFAITDGALPSNEGRGYVLRRLLRRAARFGRQIGCVEPYLYRLVPVVIDIMGEAFPEIIQRRKFVEDVIRSEEERFSVTLEQGLERFNIMSGICLHQREKTVPGKDVFTLYDTYGFPMDLTRLMAAEQGLAIDEKDFGRLMEEQKTRGREARKAGETGLTPEGWTELAPCAGTTFVGYEQDEATVNVCRYKITDSGEGRPEYFIILDTTPFYAASGGQVGDIGELRTTTEKTLIVEDTIKWNDLVVHRCRADALVVKEDFSEPLNATISRERREAIRRNHSATHLLQAALRQALGSHVQQSGSRVDAASLRFDFTHFKALEQEQLDKAESLINEWVLEDLKVDTEIMDPEAAKKAGAMALFGEKYGDRVRVVSMGGVSKELCGGTHVSSTGRIGLFHITEETSIAAGVRRIEAITGMESVRYMQRTELVLGEATALFKTNRESLMERLASTLETVNNLESRLAEMSKKENSGKLQNIFHEALSKQDRVKWEVYDFGRIDPKSFSDSTNMASDMIRAAGEYRNVFVAFVGIDNDKNTAMLSGCAGPEAIKNGINSGELVKAAALKVNGSGGGSPARAQAGGKDPSKIPEAIEEIKRIIRTKAAP